MTANNNKINSKNDQNSFQTNSFVDFKYLHVSMPLTTLDYRRWVGPVCRMLHEEEEEEEKKLKLTFHEF